MKVFIECPYCYAGIVFHPTYGSEKKCKECLGKGVVSTCKLKILGWIKPDINYLIRKEEAKR